VTVAADPRKPRVELRRRRRADGTVSVKSTVRWTDPDGTRRRRGFDTFEEADLERARLALELAQTGTIGGTKDNTLAALWPIYRADAVARLAEATIISYDRGWSRHLAPRFGDVALDEITPRSVAQWRADMLAKGIGRETVRRAMVLLQAMFTLGVEWGEAERNPVSVVRKPRQGRLRAIEVLDPATVEAVRRALLASGDYFSATLVSVLAYAGVRPGEAIGLERRHVREDTILVEQAVSYGKLKLQKTGRVYRTVDLLPELREDILTWCDMKDITRPDTPLFGRSDGAWMTLDDWKNWRRRSVNATTEAIGLGRPRPYDLRHSFASLMIRDGNTSIVELAEQLGHSPTETLKTYAHVFAEHRRQPRVPASELIRAARRSTTT
jgi:integrase